jgi:hypothetical protein
MRPKKFKSLRNQFTRTHKQINNGREVLTGKILDKIRRREERGIVPRCPVCHKEGEWVSNEVVYGKQMGESYMIYYCEEHNTRVGCHKNSRTALGEMAGEETRKLRRYAHQIFDPLWKGDNAPLTRGQAYKLLHDKFDKIVHFGESSEDDCNDMIPFIHELRERYNLPVKTRRYVCKKARTARNNQQS